MLFGHNPILQLLHLRHFLQQRLQLCAGCLHLGLFVGKSSFPVRQRGCERFWYVIVFCV
jgi:hypothetical protein